METTAKIEKIARIAAYLWVKNLNFNTTFNSTVNIGDVNTEKIASLFSEFLLPLNDKEVVKFSERIYKAIVAELTKPESTLHFGLYFGVNYTPDKFLLDVCDFESEEKTISARLPKKSSMYIDLEKSTIEYAFGGYGKPMQKITIKND